MTLPSPLFDRLRLPVIGSPLFIVSGPDLVIAQCKAGIVGSFPALNARPKEMLEEWLKRIPQFRLDPAGKTTWSEGTVRGPRQLPVLFGKAN